jgi:uncharacterized protein YjdB
MKAIHLLFISLALFCPGMQTSAKIYTPSSANSITGGSTYCQGATANLISFSYNTCHAGNGSASGVAMTVSWYVNTINSMTGGTAVKTYTVSCVKAASGSVGYLPSTSTPGTYYYYCIFTWAGTGTCNASGTLTSGITVQVIIKANPQPITGNATICVGTTRTLSNAATGGTWSSSNMSIATVDMLSGIVRGISSGSTTISYSTGCGSPATASVYVSTMPAAISGSSSVCTGHAIALSDAAPGGTWSSSNTSVATAGSASGVITGVSGGTAAITYNTGCGTAVSKTVTVNASPTAILGPTMVCAGSTATLSDLSAGGVWSSTNPSIAMIGSLTGVVTGAVTGTTTISYYNGSCAAITTVSVTTVPVPISGSSSVCTGQTVILSDAVPGGSWSSSNASKATVDAASGAVTGVASGTCTISYTTICGLPATKSITVLVSPAAITGSNSICPGATTTLHSNPVTGTWSSSNAGIATTGGTGPTAMVTGVTGGTALISYTVGSCSAIDTVSVTPLVSSGTIIGTPSVCEGQVTLLRGMARGTWTSGNTLIAGIDSTGIVSGMSAGTAIISYSVSNSCVTSAAVVVLTVNALPNADVINGSLTVCPGKTISLSDTATGGTWGSSNIAIATVSSAGIVGGIATGTAIISYTVTNGCGSDYATATVTINPLPPVISGTPVVCVEGTTVLSDVLPAGTWSSSNIDVAAINPVTGEITGEGAGTATISYTAPAGCSVTIPALVKASPTEIMGVNTICTGSSNVLTDAVTGGMWSSSNTSVASVNPTSGSVSGTTAGSSTLTYTLGTGCLITKPVYVITTTQPITGNTTVCTGLQTALCDGGGGLWSCSASSVASVSATDGLVTGINAGTAIVSYSLSCGTVTTVVTVNPNPGAPAISAMSPLSAKPLSTVTIGGSNFSTTAANNIVYFGATRATVVSATSGMLVVTVPKGAIYKPVSVGNAGCGLVSHSPKSFLPVYDNSADIAGSVNFKAPVEFIAGIHPFNLAIGDFDGDGKADIAALNVTSNTVSVFRNTSSSGTITCSSFADKIDFATGIQPFGITVGDVDGDGKLDIVVANDISNTVSVFYNTTSGSTIDCNSFADKVDFATGVNPVSVALGDIDGDGKPDIVAANYYSSTVSVLRNTSVAGGINGNSFAPKVDLAAGNHPYCVAVGDIDGDSKPDIVVANNSDNTISVYRNIASRGTINGSSFSTRVNFAAGTQPYAISIADIDGDGKPDVEVTNAVSRTVSVFRNRTMRGVIDTSSLASKVDFGTGVMPYSIAIGDIDGDGKADMVVANYGNGNPGSTSVSVFRNTAVTGMITTGSFAARVNIALNDVPRSVAVGDLDGDTKPDLAVACLSSNSVCVMRNSPLLTAGGSARPQPAPVDTVAAASSPEEGHVTIIPNPNNGEFTLSGTLGIPGTINGEVAMEITDMLGRVIFQKMIPLANGCVSEPVRLDRSASNGVYIVSLRSLNRNKCFHVLVNR